MDKSPSRAMKEERYEEMEFGRLYLLFRAKSAWWYTTIDSYLGRDRDHDDENL